MAFSEKKNDRKIQPQTPTATTTSYWGRHVLWTYGGTPRRFSTGHPDYDEVITQAITTEIDVWPRMNY